MKSKIIILLSFVLLAVLDETKAQKGFSIEAGLTYFSNDAGNKALHLADFFGVTINPRFIMSKTDNGALCLEFPLSIRSKFQEDVTSRFGIHVPLLLTYSLGSGSGGSLEYTGSKKFGGTAGLGWGYFHQRSRSVRNEMSEYNESLTACGPEIMMGARFPLKKKMVLFDRNKPVQAVLTFKGSRLFNLKNRNNDIGTFAILLGFNF